MGSRAALLGLVVPVVSGLLLACFGTPDSGLDEEGARNGASGARVPDGEPSSRATSPTPSASGSDLSCELATFLAQRCQSCHGVKRVKGADTKLVTRADLLAASPDDSNKRVIDDVLAWMKDSVTPMPPAPEPAPTAAEIALVEGWIKAGTPEASCSAAETPPLPQPAKDPYDTPTVCTSQKSWTQGDRGSDEMYPGKPCVDCHAKNIKTMFKASFDIAGTVYPTPHEPDDCYGVGGSAIKVVITDANGVVYELPVNAAGNFSHETTLGLAGKIAMPYRAKVVRNGVEKIMKDPQTNGDCNACHTEQGTSAAGSTKTAPGRVIAP